MERTDWMLDWPVLAAITLAVAATAGSGAFFRPDGWYDALKKPRITPPDIVFPVAWAVLYVMIGASLYLYMEASEPGERAVPLALFAGQLVANALWSYFFFHRKRIDLAMIDLVALGILVAATIFAFADASPTSAWLLVPYLVWVCFAGVLNGTILLWNDPRPRAVPTEHHQPGML